MAHAADPPDVACQCAQTAGDFEVVLVQQVLDDCAVVDAVGHADGVQAREPEVVGGVHLKSHALDAGFQRASDAQVAVPAFFDAFLGDEAKRLTERIHVRNRGRVMVGAFLAPVPFQQRDVQVPRAGL